MKNRWHQTAFVLGVILLAALGGLAIGAHAYGGSFRGAPVPADLAGTTWGNDDVTLMVTTDGRWVFQNHSSDFFNREENGFTVIDRPTTGDLMSGPNRDVLLRYSASVLEVSGERGIWGFVEPGTYGAGSIRYVVSTQPVGESGLTATTNFYYQVRGNRVVLGLPFSSGMAFELERLE